MDDIIIMHGTKGDYYVKYILNDILYGPYTSIDLDPRPSWPDGTKAHTYSVNAPIQCVYDKTKGESPITTLRNTPWKGSLGEILWIYRDQDNNIYNLETKYGVRWWRSWVVNPYHYDEHGKLQPGPNPYGEFYYDQAGKKNRVIRKGQPIEKSDTVDPITDMDYNKNILDYESGNVLTPQAHLGHTYGRIIRDCYHDEKYILHCIKQIITKPDDRRNIMNMMQVKELAKGTILPPCAYETQWFVAYGKDGVRYIDMKLTQRSSDFVTAGVINQVQYELLLLLVANEATRITGIPHIPRLFIWSPGNVQIYDRHVDAAKELLAREPIDCSPYFEIAKDVPFKDMKVSDVILKGMPEKGKIKTLSSKLEVAI